MERSIINEIIFQPDAAGVVKDPELNIQWLDNHPGDDIESTILSYYKKQDKKNHFSHFITDHGTISFLHWNSKLKAGITITNRLFGDTTLITPIGLWAKTIWHFHNSEPKDIDDFTLMFKNFQVEEIVEESDKILNPDWLKLSLEGGTISVQTDNEQSFIAQVENILATFPWVVYFVKAGEFIDNTVSFSFQKGVIENVIDYEELYLSLVGETNEIFWRLLYQAVGQLIHTPPINRFGKIRKSIELILYITKDDDNVIESLNLIKSNIQELFDLDVEFTSNFVTQALLKTSNATPSHELAKLLLTVSETIHETTSTDLVKLAEGTALQIAFNLKEFEQRQEIFLQVTEKSKNWGITHLVGYIQSVTGILSDTSDNRKILSKIISSSESMLKETWDGLLCLVETNIIAGDLVKAVTVRLEAVNRLFDKFARAEDAFSAIDWALELDGIEEKTLFDLISPVISEVVEYLPIGEIFISTIERFVSSCLTNEKHQILINFINWINLNIVKIGINDRLPLLEMFENNLRNNKTLNLLYVQVQLIKFNLYVEEPDNYSIDKAEDLLRTIYNSIDPDKKNSADIINHITSWIILTSARLNLVEFIEEAKTRFTLMIRDEQYLKNNLIQIYKKAGDVRAKLPRSKLKRNGLGVKFYSEAIDLANIKDDIDFLQDILPRAKQICIKKQSYPEFAKFSILEITIAHLNEDNWIDIAFVSAEELVDKGVIDEANEIFNHLYSMDLTVDQEYDVLNKQLGFVEVEPDLMDATQIFEKRNRLIQIYDTNNENIVPEDIVEHYRNGISELMSKGDVDHLNELILKAIIFADTHQLESATEFSNILMDSFETNLKIYEETRSIDVYRSLIKNFRQVISGVKGNTLNLPMVFAKRIIQVNLILMKNETNSTYLRRAQLITREIAIVLSDLNMQGIVINQLVKDELLITVADLLEKIISKDDNFGIIDASILAAFFYYNINETQEIFLFVDQTLAQIKRDLVKSKQVSSLIIIGFLVVCEIYLIIDAEIINELRDPLQTRAVKLLDVALSLGSNKELTEKLIELKDNMLNSPQGALQELPFNIEKYLQLIDYYQSYS